MTVQMKTGDRAALRWFRASYGALFIIAALFLFLGLGATLHLPPFEPPYGNGWPYIVAGLIFIVLGIFVVRRSLITLGIAIALYAIPTLIGLLNGDVTGLFIRIILIFFLVRGFIALRGIKAASGLVDSAATQARGPL
jgi:hypothetical protein